MARLLLFCLPAIAGGLVMLLALAPPWQVVGGVLVALPLLILAQAGMLWGVGHWLALPPRPEAGEELSLDLGDVKWFLAQLTAHAAFLYGVITGRAYFVVLATLAVLLMHWLKLQDRGVLRRAAAQDTSEELSPYDDPWAVTRPEQQGKRQ